MFFWSIRVYARTLKHTMSPCDQQVQYMQMENGNNEVTSVPQEKPGEAQLNFTEEFNLPRSSTPPLLPPAFAIK